MNIRPAGVNDACAIAVVHVRSWQAAYQGWVPQHYLDSLDAGQRCLAWERILGETQWPWPGTFVAEGDNDVVGFVSICPTRDGDENSAFVGEVSALYVLPKAWGTGAGRRLMGAAVDSLARAGFGQATLWVLDKNSEPDGSTRTAAGGQTARSSATSCGAFPSPKCDTAACSPESAPAPEARRRRSP